MSPWGKFQIRKAECFALQVNTSIKLFNRLALPNRDLIHPRPSSLQWTCWYLNRSCEPAWNTVFQTHSSVNQLQQFATDNDAEFVDVGLVSRIVIGIENIH